MPTGKRILTDDLFVMATPLNSAGQVSVVCDEAISVRPGMGLLCKRRSP